MRENWSDLRKIVKYKTNRKIEPVGRLGWLAPTCQIFTVHKEGFQTGCLRVSHYEIVSLLLPRKV